MCCLVLCVCMGMIQRVWELIGGYDEVYDGWWGYDDIHFAWEMIVKGGCIPVVLGGTEVRQPLNHETNENVDVLSLSLCMCECLCQVYHQEPYGSGWTPVGGVINKDGSSNPRLNKAANPNWKRICDTIPGYVCMGGRTIHTTDTVHSRDVSSIPRMDG